MTDGIQADDSALRHPFRINVSSHKNSTQKDAFHIIGTWRTYIIQVLWPALCKAESFSIRSINFSTFCHEQTYLIFKSWLKIFPNITIEVYFLCFISIASFSKSPQNPPSSWIFCHYHSLFIIVNPHIQVAFLESTVKIQQATFSSVW